MPYTKTIWSDRAVQYPRRYKDQNNVQYTFTPDEGTVTNAGTSITATRMNNIENQVQTLTNTAENGQQVIYKTTLSTTTANFNVTIPSGIKEIAIQISCIGTDASARSLLMRFNNDTAGNYSYSIKGGASNTTQTSITFLDLVKGTSSNSLGIAKVNIYNIATKYKPLVYLSEYQVSSSYGNGEWANNSNEISSIQLVPAVGSFNVGTRILVTGTY